LTSRRYEDEYGLGDLFEKQGVDLVLTGHTHIYERSFPLRQGRRTPDNRGVIYIVSAGGVGGNYPAHWTQRMMFPVEWDRPHYQVFHVEGNQIRMESFALSRETKGNDAGASIKRSDSLILSKDPQFASSLLKELQDLHGSKSEENKAVALLEQLGALTYLSAAPSILPWLDVEHSAPVRHAAANALSKIASQNVVDELLPYLEDDDVFVLRRVASAIGLAALPGMHERLRPVFTTETDIHARVALIDGLRLSGDPACLPLLLDLLVEDDNQDIRRAASYGVKEMAAFCDRASYDRTISRLDEALAGFSERTGTDGEDWKLRYSEIDKTKQNFIQCGSGLNSAAPGE
jgi:hypothetical protein